ncbi:MAG: GDP-mannose 4,6-dehydratase [Planctomycetaceae bacterium]|nr:GDP-mannose 4,6-dehydratase [Planctomycetaceae bacterium]
MDFLITGGAGFIGSHLAERCLREGHRVTVIDDLSTGSADNLKNVQGNSQFEFVYDSVRNDSTMHLLVEKCDAVFHLAAAVGVQLIVDRPVHTIETNIHGTEVVLSIANKFRKKVLVASTSEVYGKSEAIPFSEDDDTVLGSTRFSRWSYACSKAIDEFLALAYHGQYGLPVVLVRLFNTVGPRQTGRYGMVIPRFVDQALSGRPIQIYGDGKQTRCFCCVHDTVDGLMALMKCPQADGRVFNLGSSEEITIEALADKILSLTGGTGGKEYLSYEAAYGKPFDDMRRRVPSLERIEQCIQFQRNYTLEDTLRLVIEDKKKKRVN